MKFGGAARPPAWASPLDAHDNTAPVCPAAVRSPSRARPVHKRPFEVFIKALIIPPSAHRLAPSQYGHELAPVPGPGGDRGGLNLCLVQRQQCRSTVPHCDGFGTMATVWPLDPALLNTKPSRPLRPRWPGGAGVGSGLDRCQEEAPAPLGLAGMKGAFCELGASTCRSHLVPRGSDLLCSLCCAGLSPGLSPPLSPLSYSPFLSSSCSCCQIQVACILLNNISVIMLN